MIYGERNLTKLIEIWDDPFVIDTATLAVYLPDGSLDPSPPEVACSPLTSNVKHVLSAQYLPTEAGAYSKLWSFTVDSEPFERRDPDWSYWTDVPSAVRDARGGVSASKLPDAPIARQFGLMYTYLQIEYNAPAYANLIVQDRVLIDNALAYGIAMKLAGYQYGVASGPLQQIKTGNNFEFKFATGTGLMTADQLIAESEKILNLVSFIRAFKLAFAQSWNMHSITGPQRALHSANTPAFDLIGHMLDRHDNPNRYSPYAWGVAI